MKTANLPLLACPHCQQELLFEPAADTEPITDGELFCSHCERYYPVCDGIVQFIDYGELSGANQGFAHLYDKMSPYYFPISQVAQGIGALFGISRGDLIQRLEPKGGRFLEVSIGPGVNLPYFFAAAGVDEVFGLDISLGQLQRCQKFCQKKGWAVDLFLAQAEELPFKDNSFEGVLHFGGINFFTDKSAALHEMIRVARPGARIVIADENEGLARVYDWSIPGFKQNFAGKRDAVVSPINLLPEGMKDLQAENLWFGAIYCLSFTKP